MKKPIIFLLFILLSRSSKADCSDWSLSAWPSGNTVRTTGIFMLEGYGSAQDVIEQLNIKYPVYLISGEEKIKLLVKETHKGQFLLTQAILTPEKKLTVDKNYRLFIENMDGYGQPKKYNVFTQEMEEYSWKVIKGDDKHAPMWEASPVEKDKSIAHYGCGPAVYVFFKCEVNEPGSFLVRTHVTDAQTLKTTTYYLEPQKGLIGIGHGMCAGAFTFANNAYEVSFDLVDAAGNTTYWPGNRIKFTPPGNDAKIKKKK